MFETLEMWDRALLFLINSFHTSFLDQCMWQISQTWHNFVFIFIIAYVFYKRFELKRTVSLLLGCALVFACTDLSSNITKHNIKRYRPTHNLEIKERIHKVNGYEGGKYGFFSGHAANTFGVTSFLFFCFGWVNKKYRLLFFIYPIVVSYSRMYLGVHYPSDIFVGWLDGLLFGMLGYYIMNAQFFKFSDKNT